MHRFLALLLVALCSAVPAAESTADLLATADAAFSKDDYATAQDLFERAAAAAESAKQQPQLVEALAMVARSHLIREDKEAGRPWLARAAAVAKADEPLGWSRFLGVRGRFEWKDEHLDVARTTFVEMYDYCLQHALTDRAIDAAHMVAIVSPPDAQIEWAEKGIAAAEQAKAIGWLGPLWNNLGGTYEELGRHQESLEAFLKAREYHYQLHDEDHEIVADWAVARAYRLAGRLDEARKLQDATCARAKARADAEPKDGERTEHLGWCECEQGELAAAAGDVAQALELLRASRTHLIASGIETWGAEDLEKFDARLKEIEGAAATKK